MQLSADRRRKPSTRARMKRAGERRLWRRLRVDGVVMSFVTTVFLSLVDVVVLVLGVALHGCRLWACAVF